MKEPIAQGPVDVNVIRLPRYVVKWNGPTEPIATPMPDGFWTPWHIAEEAIARLRTEIDVQSYWGPKWEAERNEVLRLRKIIEKNGLAL